MGTVIVLCGIIFVWSWGIMEKIDRDYKVIEAEIEESLRGEKNIVATDFNMSLSDVTRFEVIDHSLPYPEAGRVYTKWGIEKLEFSIQDEGRTLKVFISKNNEHI